MPNLLTGALLSETILALKYDTRHGVTLRNQVMVVAFQISFCPPGESVDRPQGEIDLRQGRRLLVPGTEC
jgi:hypothetical protein